MSAQPQKVPRDVLEVERPEQLKALGHPLRLKVLQVLGESERPLTNRELAASLSVDPGHLHFHVRMLHRAGLIELADVAGREKPYRPVAKHFVVGQEVRATGLASDLQGAQLRELQEKLLSAAQESFQAGYGTNLSVIEQETYLAQAQTTEVVAKAAWLKAAAQLDRVTGQMLDRTGISLKDRQERKQTRQP